MENLEVRAFHSFADDEIQIYGRVNGKPVIRTEWEVADNRSMSRPMLRLEQRQAQILIDDLWAVGLRPTQGKQSEGMFAAQGRHLEDMRAIAFDKIKVEKPNGKN